MTKDYRTILNKGDDGSVAEELFSEVSSQEEKYLAVEESVKEKYFTLDEAINAYEVDRTEYLDWHEKK